MNTRTREKKILMKRGDEKMNKRKREENNE
jgi:hypothetical protein